MKSRNRRKYMKVKNACMVKSNSIYVTDVPPCNENIVVSDKVVETLFMFDLFPLYRIILYPFEKKNYFQFLILSFINQLFSLFMYTYYCWKYNSFRITNSRKIKKKKGCKMSIKKYHSVCIFNGFFHSLGWLDFMTFAVLTVFIILFFIFALSSYYHGCVSFFLSYPSASPPHFSILPRQRVRGARLSFTHFSDPNHSVSSYQTHVRWNKFYAYSGFRQGKAVEMIFSARSQWWDLLSPSHSSCTMLVQKLHNVDSKPPPSFHEYTSHE